MSGVWLGNFVDTAIPIVCEQTFVDTTGAPTALVGGSAACIRLGTSTLMPNGVGAITTSGGFCYVTITPATAPNSFILGADYFAFVANGTVGGTSVIGYPLGRFSLGNRGIQNVNATQINAVSTGSVTTIAANVGTTQPINFTGSAGSALVKSDMVDVAGAASQGAAGYVGIDWSKVTSQTTAVNLTATTVSSVTGAVGSVTGNVGGNVTGSVGSVVGNVGGNVGGSVGSVTAAVTIAAGQILIKRNVALANFKFPMTDSTTHAPKTGLTVSATRDIDGAGFGACANAVSEVASGWYTINFENTDVNGVNIAFRMTAPGADDLNFSVITQL